MFDKGAPKPPVRKFGRKTISVITAGHRILGQARGGPQYLETFRAGADPGSTLSW